MTKWLVVKGVELPTCWESGQRTTGERRLSWSWTGKRNPRRWEWKVWTDWQSGQFWTDWRSVWTLGRGGNIAGSLGSCPVTTSCRALHLAMHWDITDNTVKVRPSNVISWKNHLLECTTVHRKLRVGQLLLKFSGNPFLSSNPWPMAWCHHCWWWRWCTGGGDNGIVMSVTMMALDWFKAYPVSQALQEELRNQDGWVPPENAFLQHSGPEFYSTPTNAIP